MAKAKASRDKKQQWGQFMTPPELARRVVSRLEFSATEKVLEPSFGDGSFLIALIERLMEIGPGDPRTRFERIMTEQIYGVELDSELADRAIAEISNRWGPIPEGHNLVVGDFFRTEFFMGQFDAIVGNPPFGGTFDSEIEDQLDRRYGKWDGHKLKKETYSFFIARSLDWLSEGGTLCFISSDTFMTIKTMGGLRRRLMDQSTVSVEHLEVFSDETAQPTLVLTGVKSAPSRVLVVDGKELTREDIESTGNFSWKIDATLIRYFRGPCLGEFIIGTGGMTIGKNEYFVREVVDGEFVEPYSFEFFEDPVTLEKELAKARLGKLSTKLANRIQAQEDAGETVRNIRVVERAEPLTLPYPHPDYLPYNKASSAVVYAPPKWVVFWKDDGDAVLTFKKNGNWYLHGVGGQKFFKREGLTWQLVSPRIKMRYLPAGYILDSGAPCAFLRPGVDHEELWFILGWCQTSEASRILKTVINHTRNVQSKDIERLPYPWWVDQSRKKKIVRLVRAMLGEAMAGREFSPRDKEFRELDKMFAFEERAEANAEAGVSLVSQIA